MAVLVAQFELCGNSSNVGTHFLLRLIPQKETKIEDHIGKIPSSQTFTNIHTLRPRLVSLNFLKSLPFKPLRSLRVCNRLNEACWLQGSNVTEFETPMAIAGPRACDEPQVVSLKQMQLDAVLNCAKARMANLGDETWRVLAFTVAEPFSLTFSMLLCKVTFAGLQGHKNVCFSIRSTKMPDFLGSEMSKGSPPAWRLPHYQRGVSFFFFEKRNWWHRSSW